MQSARRLIPTYDMPKSDVNGALRTLMMASEARSNSLGNIVDVFTGEAKRQQEAADRKIKEEDRAFALSERERALNERKAMDAFYGEVAKGPQTVGGVLNRADVIAQSDAMSFTPEEIKEYDSAIKQFGDDRLVSELNKQGKTDLAKKVEWQKNIGDFAGSDAPGLKESRLDLLGRAMKQSKDASGGVVPYALVDKYESALLAEREAKKALNESDAKKLETIDKQIMDLRKDNYSDQRWAIGQQGIGGGSSSVVVNPETGESMYVQTPQAQYKESVTDKKKAEEFVTDMTKRLKEDPKFKGLNVEKVSAVTDAARLKMSEKYSQLRELGYSHEAASGAIENALSTKDDGWIWDDPVANLNDSRVASALQSYRTATQGTGATSINGVPTRTNQKGDLASNYLTNVSQDRNAMLNDLLAKRSRLLAGSEGGDVLGASLTRAGILPSVAKTSTEALKDNPALATNGFNVNNYLAKAIDVESSGNSKAQNGQHYGLGQFKQSTVEELGLDWNRYKNDPAYQVEATKAYALKNASLLEKNGYPVNDFTVYMAHNQGPGGALKVLDSIKNGTPLDRTTKLNLLNQGIAPTTLPRASNGQLDYSKISDEALSKYSDADVLNAYVGRYGTKMGADVDTDRLNTSYKKLKEASPAAVADKVTTGEEAKKVLEKVPSRTASETSRIAANYAKVADTIAEGDFKDLTPKEIQEVREYMFSPKKSPFYDAYNNYKKDTPFKYDVNEKRQLLDDMLAAEGLSTEEEIRGYMNTLSKPDKLLLERHLKLKNSGAVEADRASRLIRDVFEKSSKERTGMDKIINDIIHNNHPINYFGR